MLPRFWYAFPPTGGAPGPTYLRPLSCPQRFWWRKPQSVVFSSLAPKPEPLVPQRPLPARPLVRPCWQPQRKPWYRWASSSNPLRWKQRLPNTHLLYLSCWRQTQLSQLGQRRRSGHRGHPRSVCESPASRRARWYGYLLHVQVLLVVAHRSHILDTKSTSVQHGTQACPCWTQRAVTKQYLLVEPQ